MQRSQHLQWCCGIIGKLFLWSFFIGFAISVEGQIQVKELSTDSRNINPLYEKKQMRKVFISHTTYQIASTYLLSWIVSHKDTLTLLEENAPNAPTPIYKTPYTINPNSRMIGETVAVNLDALVTGGSGAGTWSQVGNAPMSMDLENEKIVDLNNAIAGTYTFRYTQSRIGYSDLTTDVKIKVLTSVAPCPSAPCNGVWDGNN